MKKAELEKMREGCEDCTVCTHRKKCCSLTLTAITIGLSAYPENWTDSDIEALAEEAQI